jgi:xanthine/uracil permease
VSQARTLWEEGTEPGYQVVALGTAAALTVVVLDLWRADQVTHLFDVVFVLTCVAVALLVRPEDFFTVGVLPPLIMGAVFLLVGLTDPGAIADRDDGLVQAVVSGLSNHAEALGLGYALCLGCLAVRRRYLTGDEAATTP